jgi:hypothetical protein
MDEVEFAAMQAERLATLMREAVQTRTVTSEMAMLASEVVARVDSLWKKTRG